MESEREVRTTIENKNIKNEKAFKTEVVTEIDGGDGLIIDGLIAQFDEQCDALRENIHTFADVVDQRSNLIEDIAPSNMQLLIDQFREENEDLQSIRNDLEKLITKLKEFNLKLQPLKADLVPKSETINGAFQPKTAEGKVAKAHESYFKVCTALSLEPNSLEAVRIYSRMSPEDVRAFIPSQNVEQAEKKVSKPETISGLKKSPSMTNLKDIPLSAEEKADNDLKKALGLENISAAEWQQIVREQEWGFEASRKAYSMSSTKETEEKKLSETVADDENIVEKALLQFGKSNGKS